MCLKLSDAGSPERMGQRSRTESLILELMAGILGKMHILVRELGVKAEYSC